MADSRETPYLDNFTDFMAVEEGKDDIPSENTGVDIPDLLLLDANSGGDLISDKQSDSSSLLSFEAPTFSPILSHFEPNLENTHCPDRHDLQSDQKWTGFKVVGDNLDKNICSSFSRLDKKTRSLHYFHHYAVLDRIELSSFSDKTPNDPVDVTKLLVTTEDIAQLESDCVILIQR